MHQTIMPLTPPHQGFTLIEALVVVALLSVLAGLAAPSFRTLQQRWSVLQAMQAMESSLVYARSESIRTAGRVAIHRADSGCAVNWGCGWVVFADDNGDGAQSAKEPTLQRVDLGGDLQIDLGGKQTALKLDRYGALVDVNSLAIAFTPAQAAALPTQMLCVSRGWHIHKIQGDACS